MFKHYYVFIVFHLYNSSFLMSSFQYQTLFVLLLSISTTVSGQQLENNSFENWSSASDAQEPDNWNTIMTGDLCRFCSFIASQRVFQDTREVIDGQSSIRIESKSILGGIIFNGSITTGQIAVPSASASAGYNQSLRKSSEFSQRLQVVPDSLVFWAKYSITDNSDSALVAFFIHGETDLKVPVPEIQVQSVVATVHKTFQTDGSWKRVSLPFKMINAEENPAYVLATFSSSFAAGKGNGTAKLWVDKVEFVYNNEQLTLDSK